MTFLASPEQGCTGTLKGESGMCSSLNLMFTVYSPIKINERKEFQAPIITNQGLSKFTKEAIVLQGLGKMLKFQTHKKAYCDNQAVTHDSSS